jgi:hypothetical protein
MLSFRSNLTPIRIITLILGLMAVLIFGVLTLFTVPRPSDRTAMEVTGMVTSIATPHPDYGDLNLVLAGDRKFYVNRANELNYFAWEQFLFEVHPGDTVHLMVVPSWISRYFDSGSTAQPVAGVWTAGKMYMDPAVSAATWAAQGNFQSLTYLALGICILCLLPEILRIANRVSTAKTNPA